MRGRTGHDALRFCLTISALPRKALNAKFDGSVCNLNDCSVSYFSKYNIACRDFLKAHGVEVLMSRTTDENDPVTDEINECNAFEPDLAVDIHNNSGGGDGFEIFYHYKGGISKNLAENIEDEVKKIGQNSRGCKTKLNSNGSDYYAFIRGTICPAVICEGCFVDNETDVQIADSIEKQKAFGVAYAKGSREPRHASRAHNFN